MSSSRAWLTTSFDKSWAKAASKFSVQTLVAQTTEVEAITGLHAPSATWHDFHKFMSISRSIITQKITESSIGGGNIPAELHDYRGNCLEKNCLGGLGLTRAKHCT